MAAERGRAVQLVPSPVPAEEQGGTCPLHKSIQALLPSAQCSRGGSQTWKMTTKGARAAILCQDIPWGHSAPTLILLLLTMLLSGPTDPCQESEMLDAHILTQIWRCAGRAAAC